MTLVDTNVLIDILTDDPVWANRSIETLAAGRRRGPLAINDTVYAELSAGFAVQAEVDEAIAEMGLRLAPMTRPALFLAGQTFRRYRASGGQRSNILADFFIGALASAEGWPLITRDQRLYRSYFVGAAIVAVA